MNVLKICTTVPCTRAKLTQFASTLLVVLNVTVLRDGKEMDFTVQMLTNVLMVPFVA